MNLQQLSFRMGFLRDYLQDAILLSFSYLWIEHTIANSDNIDTNSILQMILGSTVGFLTIRSGISNISQRLSSRKIKKFPEYQSDFDKIDKIVIEDSAGLEYILNRTMNNERLEWGGAHKTDIINGTAYVRLITTDKEDKDLIKYRLPIGVSFNSEYMHNYSGIYHYHPNIFTKYLGAINYYVTYMDKFSGGHNTLNLLSFNLNSGPEIIGFNHINIFIPESKTKKNILVKANKGTILDYLKT